MKNTSPEVRREKIYQILKTRNVSDALSIAEIYELLINDGVDCNLRTVRRDLTYLSTNDGICSTDSHPEKFFVDKDFDFKYRLRLSEETLQVLSIALNNLKATSHLYFKNLISEAENAIFDNLDDSVSKDIKTIKERYHFDFSASGKPSSKDIKDFEQVMKALRDNKIITCQNHSPYKDDEYNKKTRTFAPYIFVLTAGIPYLIAEDLQDGNYKKLRMSRLKKVRITEDSFKPKNIKNKLHLKYLVGGWGGIDSNHQKMSFTCDEVMASYFKEKTIHESQIISKINENTFKVELDCALSSEIARLIASFGGHVYDITPSKLKSSVESIWKQGLKKAA